VDAARSEPRVAFADCQGLEAIPEANCRPAYMGIHPVTSVTSTALVSGDNLSAVSSSVSPVSPLVTSHLIKSLGTRRITHGVYRNPVVTW